MGVKENWALPPPPKKNIKRLTGTGTEKIITFLKEN